MRKKRSSPPDLYSQIVGSVPGLVDPRAMIEAELQRATRDLLAGYEKDMSIIDRIRLRVQLWKLRRKFGRLKREARG